jgi:hypothetical protein
MTAIDRLAGKLGGPPQPMSYYRIVPVPAPGAGNDWSLTVPGGVTWRLQSLYISFVASAAVATRIPSLRLTDGTTTLFNLPPVIVVPASTGLQFTYLNGIGPYLLTSLSTYAVQPFPDLNLKAGWVLRSITQAIDAGDTWIAGTMLVIEQRDPGPTSDVVRESDDTS